MSTNSRLRGTSIPSAPNDRSSVKEVCFASDGIQSKIKMRDGKMVFDQYIGMEESVEKEKESQYRAATLRPKSADDQTSQQKRELILTKQQKSPNKKPGEMLTNMAAAEFKKTAKVYMGFPHSKSPGCSSLLRKTSNFRPNFEREFPELVANRIPISVPSNFLQHHQYHSSDRTLLAILEDERQKFINLEGQYSTLLNEVQALQSNHLEDLRNSGRKYDADAKNLQRALVLKSEECNDAQKDLSHWQSKYSKDSSLWLNTNEKLEDHLHTIQRDIRDLEEKLKDKDATVQEFRNEKQVVVEKIVRREKEVVERASTRERELVLKFQAMEKDLKDRITKREGDLKKYIYLAREKESCLLAEKEERMKLEVSNLQLEHVASQRDEEVKQLKIVLQRKQLEVEEVIKLKNNLIDARRDLEALADREKTYLEEIRSYQYRDSKTAVRSEELTMALKKLTVELERVSAERAMSMQEAKILRENEGHLRREVDERGRNVEQVMENFHALQNKDKQTQQNMARLQNDLGDTQTFNSELRQKNSEYFAKLQEGFQTIQDVQKAQADADTISRREKEDQYERQQQLSLELQKRQMDVSELQRNFSDCRNQLETEVKSKNDLQHRNKDTLVGLQNKMVEVQNVLKETQIQVQELRGVENQLRQVIVERDGLVTQHSGKISELQTVLSREQYERENLKSKKKDELNMVQDKFINAKQTMESEITTLRNAVQQKSVQINMLNEEVNQLRVDSSENSNQRFKAAEEVNRLKLEFSDHARQFTGLQQQALQKDQENSILHLKLSSLSDQIKRMDEEVRSSYRTSFFFMGFEKIAK